MAYFITDENSTKGRDPNINIISGIHCIKGKTYVNVLMSNYTNTHIKFNKGEYIGCLESTKRDSMPSDQQDIHTTNSVPLQKMMAEQVQPGIFDPAHHKLKPGIQSKLAHFSRSMLLNLPKMRHPLEQQHQQRRPLILTTLTAYPRNHTLLP